MLFADIDGKSLDRFHPLAVDLLDDGLRARDLELVALSAHSLDEHRQVQLPAATHQETLGCLGVFDMQPEVDIELLVQPRTQLSCGRKLALATGERRRVDAERHPHCRLVDPYAGKWIRRLRGRQ